MARIYLGLASFSFSLLVLNILLGLWTDDYGEVANQWISASREVKELEKEGRRNTPAHQDAVQLRDATYTKWQPLSSRATTHMLVGIAAALVAVLVNSISVTYFIGTSRWCREVADAYHLDPAYADRSLQLKRRTFPYSLLGILTIILIVGLGASSDPGANLTSHLFWRTWHFFAAVLGTMFIGYAFLVQVRNVGANYQIIEQILSEVKRIREERGLAE